MVCTAPTIRRREDGRAVNGKPPGDECTLTYPDDTRGVGPRGGTQPVTGRAWTRRLCRERRRQPRQDVPVREERVFRTLRLLPRSEVDDIMEKNEEIEVKCEFCGKRYCMSPEKILANLKLAPKE